MSTASETIKRLRAELVRLAQANIKLERALKVLMRRGGQTVVPKYPFVVMVWRRVAGTKLGNSRRALVVIDIKQGDLAAVRDQVSGNGEAQARYAAGHDGADVVELHEEFLRKKAILP